ncbi:branched-chain-amino-acid transaminase [Ancylostoma ceylanicum]|uniref:Branched-chain-amino-acid aminotransferase n=3 Tax=Ancylostoma ceylanicum TaxID=53326 RepID=A0A0D6M696_9BILA|nr:branched-chain-amino-acid transaminase [Ancylostoma ceylanicum]
MNQVKVKHILFIIFHQAICTEFSISASNNAADTFYHKDLQIKEAKPDQRRPLPKEGDQLGFGALFSDHMLETDYTGSEWTKPIIHPYGNFSIDPASKVFHYACELFEGMKAYRGEDGRIRLFRPELNMARMRRSAARSSLPDFDGKELLECIKELIRLDQAWVPTQKGASLYIRPTIIATEPMLGVHTSKTAKLFVITGPAGAYFNTFAPVSLLADPQYIRAAKGGVGAFKMGCNYAPTLKLGEVAKEKGCHQVLWLAGPEHHVTEAGAMNVFLFWKNEQGEDELITASLESGIILPGVTRQSILELSREMGGFKVTERDFTMNELMKAIKEKRVHEMFGAGTAVVVTPIDRILYDIEGREEELKLPLMDSEKSLMQK